MSRLRARISKRELFLGVTLAAALVASGCGRESDNQQRQEDELLGDVFDSMFIYAFSTPTQSSYGFTVLEDSEDPCLGHVVDNCTVRYCRDDLSEFAHGDGSGPNGRTLDIGPVTVQVSSATAPFTMTSQSAGGFTGAISYSHTSTSVVFSGGDLLTFSADSSVRFPQGFTRHVVVPHPARPQPALPEWGTGTIDIKKGQNFEVGWTGGEDETVKASIVNFNGAGSAQIGIECQFDGWAGRGSIPASLIALLPPTSQLPTGDGGYTFRIGTRTWSARMGTFVRNVDGKLITSVDVGVRDGDYTGSAIATVIE